MELYNELSGFEPEDGEDIEARLGLMRLGIETLVKLLNPFTPHLCEQLWHEMGRDESTFRVAWPEPDPGALTEDEFELVIQVNGKVRAKARAPVAAGEDELRELALSQERVRAYTEGREIRKVIVVPGRLINIVV
jgi:leucyl-tRNA synthetase